VIPVTRPVLPPLADYTALLEGVWSRAWLTNDGPLVTELEARLAAYLGVEHVIFTSNGTIAIQLVLRALGCRGEVVTTPFSYVATTSSIVWEGCEAVFADVSPDTLTLDARQAARAITARTSAILATHVYGIPSDVDGLAALGAARGIPVVYDAAHAFGVRHRGRSLASYGTAATLSFHATKLFHTIEGGAIVTDDPALAERIRQMRSFGHDGPERFHGLGINGKNSEFHAAMGLCLLPHVPDFIRRRLALCERYDAGLAALCLARPRVPADTEMNGAYYPVLLQDEAEVLRVRAHLQARDITPRRYFYPPLNRLPYVASPPMPVAESAAERVLCLPLFADLGPTEVDQVVAAMLEALRG